MLQSLRHARWPVVAIAAAALSFTTPAGPASAVVLSPTPTPGTWGTDGTVRAILPLPGGNKLIAGSFTHVVDPGGVAHPAANLAMLDAAGVLVPSWTASTDGEVDALGLSGQTILVGGAFTQVDGHAHRSLAAVDLTTGALDKTFAATTNGRVNSIAVAPTYVVVAGTFQSVKTTAQGEVPSMRIAKLVSGTGAVDTGWAAHPNLTVNSVVLSDDFATVYVAGNFTAMGGYYRSHAAALRTADPAAITAFAPSFSMPVLKQAFYNGNVYFAATGPYGGLAAAANGTTGGFQWAYDTDGNVQAVTAYDGVVYFGGHFSYLGSTAIPRQHIGAVATTYPYPVTSWAPRVNSAQGVWDLASDGSQLLAGGDFTQVGSRARAHYAQFTP